MVLRSTIRADVVGWKANLSWRERLDVGSAAARERYMYCRTSIFSRQRETMGVRNMGWKSEQEIGCAILGIGMIVEVSHWRQRRQRRQRACAGGRLERQWNEPQAVHKKSSRSDCNNYRIIAITSIVSRLMERIIHNKITSYFITNNLLTSSKHGFQTGKLSTSNVLESGTDWVFAIDSRNNIDVLYIDLSKAFDSVVFSKLILKLGWYGIDDNLPFWLTSYLTDRQQQTVVEYVHSISIDVINGVPQGSVLGPHLFYFL